MNSIEVTNIGGITETAVELDEDVTILVGRNATNRTSLLQAMGVALGSAHTPIRSDSESAGVELTVDGETFDRQLMRENGAIRSEGSPYLDDPAVADLFAFLLEDNPARRAIERGDDLREVLLRPVDVKEIEQRIHSLQNEREELKASIDELEELESEREQLQERRKVIQSELDEVTSELESVREELEEAESTIELDANETDDEVEELRERRERLEEVQHSRETAHGSITALEQEREELLEELEELPGAVEGDIGAIDRQLETLREKQSQIDSTLSELNNVISFNDELLDGSRQKVLAAVGQSGSGGSVTDELLGDQSPVTCWTCGTEVERERIEDTLDQLRNIQQRTFEQKREIESEIESLRAEQREYRRHEREREEIESRLADIDDEIARYESQLEGLETEFEQLEEQIEASETELKAERDEAYATLLDLQREETDLSFERNRLETNLEEIDSSLEIVEERIDNRDTHETRLEEVDEEIEAARNRVQRIETETVEAFNSHMESILDLLDYENIERIWIERKSHPGGSGNDVENGSLEIHIVRSSSDGAVYEDTIDHLSESEREVMGLVFALSGYLVYDVYEEVPFLLLDSLEAIDSERIAQLVGYFEEYAANLVVALLPEDAQALPDRYRYVTEI